MIYEASRYDSELMTVLIVHLDVPASLSVSRLRPGLSFAVTD